MEDADKKYFTLVFEGDIGKFEKNPLAMVSVFGKPIVASRGDLAEKVDELEEAIEDLTCRLERTER